MVRGLRGNSVISQKCEKSSLVEVFTWGCATEVSARWNFKGENRLKSGSCAIV